METYFQGFHEDEQFSTNSLLSSVDEMMKDQLGILESSKVEENISWGEEYTKNDFVVGKEDFQQIMSDWQQHLGSLQSTESEDLGLGLDANLDMLNAYSNTDIFEEKESPILSKALKYPGQKGIVHIQPVPKSLAAGARKELFFDNLNNANEQRDNAQKISGLVKTDSNLIRKITLVNGEKEILGKNIIGLHCLNEIKENPDENCQVTSTVINGKRFKIIIKPKSLKVKKLSEEKIRKTLIKKLLQCNLVTKVEPKEDEITSEMRNGNYDVPIINSDLLPSWDFASLDSDWSAEVDNDTYNTVENTETETEPVKKVPPLRIKVPKLKKHKKKKSVNKSDEEVDVETVNDKIIEGHNITNLLENFEEVMAKLEKGDVDEDEGSDGNKKDELKKGSTSESIKSSLPKEMLDRIEALNRKKDRRIPLIQAMPTKKAGKSGTRMQDAVATMNRNKLLKIVSGGDTVQLDHDYCSSFIKTSFPNNQQKKPACLGTNLAEKNPKKDSGMESGDVSDASEGPNTPDSLQNIQTLRQINNKILEERRRIGDHTSVTKAAIAFFRATNAATINSNVNNSDSVKTKTVSNGNKALTNDVNKSNCNSDNSNSVPSDTKIKNEDVEGNNCKDIEIEKESSDDVVEQPQSIQPGEATQTSLNERPKKKLKLEEYLNRRNVKEKEKSCGSSGDCKTTENEKQNTKDSIQSTQINEPEKLIVKEKSNENTQEKQSVQKEKNNENTTKKETKDKKYWKERRRRSSSLSSGDRSRRGRRRRTRSRSGSHWRSSSNNSSSSSRRREGKGKRKYRRSESRERRRRRGFWSRSLSRSSSRESSTSSDHSGSKYYKSTSIRYRRRSRSRSESRCRSRSRNRSYSKRRRPGNYYYNRNIKNRRSRSPFYAYSMREKQRQIEERRVIYVGRIEEGMTNAKLRERFSVFGPIIDISLHFREYGDNYGFVTYAYKADAYDAVEHGNDDPSLPHYDLCFGGRRGFCKEKYADLDGMPTSYSGFNDTPVIRSAKDSFDLLLKEAQAKLKNRKKQ